MQHMGRIRNASGRGLAIDLHCAVPPGTAIKIEFEDSMMLGEAVFCKGGEGSFLLGVELDQVLCGLSELGRRLQEFARDEPSGTEVAYSVDHRQRQHHQQAQEQ